MSNAAEFQVKSNSHDHSVLIRREPASSRDGAAKPVREMEIAGYASGTGRVVVELGDAIHGGQRVARFSIHRDDLPLLAGALLEINRRMLLDG